MIQLTGKLYNIAATEATDRESGEVSKVHTAEILHTVRGKTEIAGLKLDPSVADSWAKALGRDIAVEVRFYAMKNREGGIQSGLTCADKKALPVLLRAAPAAAAA
jgi:hypothetical protein